MEQQRALNALEPFLALAPSATSPRAAADLITQATSSPTTFVFAELLEAPAIQRLRLSPEHAPYLHLLEIFSYGTWADYHALRAQLPELTPPQHQKLLLLSLLPLLTAARHAGDQRDPLAYATLQDKLQLGTPQQLERLVQAGVYAGLLDAHLDPLHQRVAVSSVAALRDLAPMSVPPLVSALAEWEARCNTVLVDLEGQIAQIKQDAADRQEQELRHSAAFEAAVREEDERSAKKAGGKRGAPGEDGPMEIDEVRGEAGGKTRGSKRNIKTGFGRL